MNIQEMLIKSIEKNGLNDKETICISEKRDKELVEIQRMRYEDWKSKNSILNKY